MEMLNKTGICSRFRWSRSQFDQRVADGMPVVQQAAHKGQEWLVSVPAVEEWLAELERAAEERRRRIAEATEAAQARRALAEAERHRADRERQQAARRAEEERHRERERERQAEADKVARRDCYSGFFKLAMVAYGVTTGPGWPQRPENRKFLADWPSGALGGPPDWWRPPPGALKFALAQRQRVSRYGDPEPDWGQFLGTYKFGDPWPWRSETADV